MSDVEAYVEPAASVLEQWGRDAHLISTVAINLVKTSFVPASYNGDPAQVVAAILTGQEVGMKPMASLRAMDIIQGVPAMRAIALRALVQSHGHEIWTAESNSTRCVVKAQRAGSDHVETSLWDLDRATKLGLTSKPNWKNQPTAMLLARATSEAARLVAADVLLGMPYSIEELLDDAPPAETKPVTRATTKVARKPLPVVEPPLPVEEAAMIAEHVEAVTAERRAVEAAPEPDREPVTNWNVAPIPTDDDAPPLDGPDLDWGDQ